MRGTWILWIPPQSPGREQPRRHRSPASDQLRTHLATAAAAALIMLAVVAAALALSVSDGAADATQPAGTQPADRGQARFEGYEAGIAAVVAARRPAPARPDETRVAAAIAAK